MKEIININIGQSGVQMAHATWELYCIEHGIGPDGKVINSDDMDDSSDTLFSRSSHDMFVPRTLFMDLEPNVIDEVRNGAYRNLFHPDLLLTGKEDAANNFARGHYTIGRDKIELTLDRIRKLVENCENLQGMVLSHSYGGGTGSGFTALLLERLAIEHSKSAKLEVSVCPSPEFSTSMVEPYNQILNIHTSTENVDISFLMDNQALYDICLNNMSISSPRYCELNRIIAQVMSSVTASTRFDGALNADLNQIQTNLVPYPRIHYPLLRHAPLISKDKADHQKQSVSELTKALFDGSCDMLKLDNKIGKYMSCAIIYRGQVTAKDTNYALSEIKRRSDITFVNWCPTGFKVGLNYQPPVTSVNSFIADSDKCATMMANTTGINQCWETLGNKFDLLFSKRAFVHWYVGDGMEEGEMNEAKEDLSLLIKDYVELNNDGSDEPEAAEANEVMEYEQVEVGEVEEAFEGYEGNEGNEGNEAYEGNEGNEGNEANEAFEGQEGFEGTEANEMNEAYEEY